MLNILHGNLGANQHIKCQFYNIIKNASFFGSANDHHQRDAHTEKIIVYWLLCLEVDEFELRVDEDATSTYKALTTIVIKTQNRVWWIVVKINFARPDDTSHEWKKVLPPDSANMII